MCELLAMSSLHPTMVDFSLDLLTRRGGAEGPHSDGWGAAFYAGRDALLLREPAAASESALVKHMERYAPASALVISHIRLATVGQVSLDNTQPFSREMGGRVHVFAHNGDLPGLNPRVVQGFRRFRPIGESDSEQAFCWLMDRLATLWDEAGGAVPALADRLAGFADVAGQLRAMGTANLLYADSDALFVHADRRRPPGTDQTMPGLHILQRHCSEPLPDLSAAGLGLRCRQQAITLFASVPLTGERWQPMRRGEILCIRGGEVTAGVAGDARDAVAAQSPAGLG